jgi:hypothetical protein
VLLTFEFRAHNRQQADELVAKLRGDPSYEIAVAPDPLIETLEWLQDARGDDTFAEIDPPISPATFASRRRSC